jgi:hypothetical protein
MRRIFFVVLGWTFVVVGAVVMPMPLPIPFVGVGPLLIGCAILTAHSKSFRRGLQRVRHRFDWVSRGLEQFKERGPHPIRAMVRRTHPLALHRQARMRARRESA